MGRNSTPKKHSTPRTLSARASPAPSFIGLSTSAEPSRTTLHSAESTASSAGPESTSASEPLTDTKQIKSASAIPAHLMAGQKRPLSDSARSSPDPVGVAPPSKKKLKRQRAKDKRDAARTAGRTKGEDDGHDAGSQEGEVVQGDFKDLFFVDTTPVVVKLDATVQQDASGHETPVKSSGDGRTALTDLSADVTAEPSENEDEDEQFQVFTREMAVSDEDEGLMNLDDDSDDDENEDENEDEAGARPFADDVEDEDSLAEAIRGKIVDDSAAKVTGRYYKEADLTKSCALCGEQGHSSRDCTHSQCFICGLVDSDHEARNCPVALICSACGSRGHFARDCRIAPRQQRGGYGQRCALCSSNLHIAANCPSLWRVYDLTGAKPTKRKIVMACGNDGSTKDHFVDDCPLPRGHPMRFADPSAFNRAALGDAAVGLPGPPLSRGGPTGASAAARRRGGDRRQDFEDDAADDDWFASRSRVGAGGRGGPGGHESSRNSHTGGGRNAPNYGNGSGGSRPPGSRNGTNGGGKPYSGGRFAQRARAQRGSGPREPNQDDLGRRSHIHFGNDDWDRFGGSPASRSGGGGGGGRDPRDDRGGGGRKRDERDNDNWRGRYADHSGGGGEGGGSSRKSKGGDGGKKRGTPSLASRIESGRKNDKPAPRYQGGYV